MYLRIYSTVIYSSKKLNYVHDFLSYLAHGHRSNTRLLPSGSTEATSRRSKAKAVMSRSTLRNRITVVSCQLARLRLLPTAQAMKAALDGGGRKTTEVRVVQLEKPSSRRVSGSGGV